MLPNTLQLLFYLTLCYTTPMKFSPQIEKWRNLVNTHSLGKGIPTDFLLRWIEVESDGQLSTVSELNERGLFQIFPEDERTNLGLSWDEFNRLSSDGDWSIVQGIRLVSRYKASATSKLASWNRTWYGSDFWKFVKLFHGSPVVIEWLHQGVVKVTGSPARDWQSFVSIGMAQLDGSRKAFAQRVIDNAEKTGKVVTGGFFPVIFIVAIIGAITLGVT